MPLEMEYADDVDFLDEEKETLTRLLPVAAEQLKEANLFENEVKTEFTHIHTYLANKSRAEMIILSVETKLGGKAKS